MILNIPYHLIAQYVVAVYPYDGDKAKNLMTDIALGKTTVSEWEINDKIVKHLEDYIVNHIHFWIDIWKEVGDSSWEMPWLNMTTVHGIFLADHSPTFSVWDQERFAVVVSEQEKDYFDYRTEYYDSIYAVHIQSSREKHDVDQFISLIKRFLKERDSFV